MKRIPDDVILVICSIFGGLLFIWTQHSGIYNKLDFWIYIGGFVSMIVPPMVWSSYCKFKK